MSRREYTYYSSCDKFHCSFWRRHLKPEALKIMLVSHKSKFCQRKANCSVPNNTACSHTQPLYCFNQVAPLQLPATRLRGLRRYIASVTGIYCVALIICAGVIYLLNLLVEQFLRLIKLRYTLSKRRKRNHVAKNCRKDNFIVQCHEQCGVKKEMVIPPIVADC